MQYLGRHQLGTWLDITLQCADLNGVAVMPTYVPVLKVWSGTALVLNDEMPLIDKTIQVGLFAYRLFLGEVFAVGSYVYDTTYVYGGAVFLLGGRFDVMAGGHSDGQVLGMHYYHRPHADFIVYQAEAGKILKGKSPRVN